MSQTQYVNPFTDFGFKKIFGEEASLPLLKNFLNALLPEETKIETLHFRNSEFLGQNEQDRKAIFDLYCENQAGEKFIVELQKAKQNFFKDRTVYYSTFPIQQQAQKGEWDYNLKNVYCVGILDFTFKDYKDEDKDRGRTVHTVQLKNDDNEVFYDKLRYIYLEMPNFKKTLDELSTDLDKWLYFLKHLEDIESIPDIFRIGDEEGIFEQAFSTAKLATLSRDEYETYTRSLKTYRDLYSVMKTAKDDGYDKGLEKGMEKGLAQGIEQALQRLIQSGMEEQEARNILNLDAT